jgi:hypothetical protein
MLFKELKTLIKILCNNIGIIAHKLLCNPYLVFRVAQLLLFKLGTKA